MACAISLPEHVTVLPIGPDFYAMCRTFPARRIAVGMGIATHELVFANASQSTRAPIAPLENVSPHVWQGKVFATLRR